MTCRDAESLLHDALDAPLPPADAAALAAHLETCAACRDLEADLSLVATPPRVARSRRSCRRTAWPALAAQLEREGLLAATARAAARRKPWQTYTWMALAASLLAGVGAALVWRADRSGDAGPAIATAPPPAAPGNARGPHAVEAIEIELRLAAEHYEKAITALEGLAAEDRTRIDPAVAQVVERNLLLIDNAIADSRKALQGQPGSLVAQASLFDAYRQKVALLQDLIAMASEAKRTGADGAGRDRRPIVSAAAAAHDTSIDKTRASGTRHGDESMHTRFGAWALAALLAAPVAAGAAPAAGRSRHRTQGRPAVGDAPAQVKTFNVGATGSLKLSNVAGDVKVTGGGGTEIKIEAVVHGKGKTEAEARAQFDSVKVDMRQSGNRVDVETTHERNSRAWVDYTVVVPTGTSIEVRTVSGDVQVSEINGSARAETVSGDVIATGLAQVAALRSVSGDVRATDLQTDGAVSFNSVSGDVTVSSSRRRSRRSRRSAATRASTAASAAAPSRRR